MRLHTASRGSGEALRIAYIADPTSPNGRYRGIYPMTALGHYRGHRAWPLMGRDGRLAPVRVDALDVLYVHRYCDGPAQQLARSAVAAGVPVVWDNDDDTGAMPRTSVTYKHFGGIARERQLADMRRLFRHATLVTAPSAVLAERFGEWGAPRVRVVENHIPDQLLEVDRRDDPGLRIGWIAGLEHAMDAERLPIRTVLQRILDERPEVEVVSVGLGLGLRGRYGHLKSVDIVRISQCAATFDIAIAPLADLDFNRARSNVKLKEYAAAGVPWLASPIGPYAGMGERQGGRLVPDDGWYEALTRLLDKPRERRKLGTRARKWAAGETLSKNLDVWEDMLRSAMTSIPQHVAN
jgi:glycosyltransferase involved in cell wall biosynthesis